MGTQVVSMADLLSTHFSPETIFDEAAGLLLSCEHLPFVLHYYQLIYQIFIHRLLFGSNIRLFLLPFLIVI